MALMGDDEGGGGPSEAQSSMSREGHERDAEFLTAVPLMREPITQDGDGGLDSSIRVDEADSLAADYGFWGETLADAEAELAEHFAMPFHGEALLHRMTAWRLPGGSLSSSVPVDELDVHGDGSLSVVDLNALNKLSVRYKAQIAEYHDELEALIATVVTEAFNSPQVVALPIDTRYRHPAPPGEWNIMDSIDAGDFTYYISVNLLEIPAIRDIVDEASRLRELRRIEAVRFF